MDEEFTAWYDKIYQYCYFHIHDRTRAEDLTQETFLRYLQRYRTGRDLDTYSGTFPPGKQLAYLYVIARNLCADHFRVRGREQPVDNDKIDGIQTGEELRHAPMDMLAESVALREAVDALPEELREIIVLRFVLEEPAASVAKIFRISRFAVYRREKEALRILREHLER